MSFVYKRIFISTINDSLLSFFLSRQNGDNAS